jgi:hypothetical protein
MDFGYHIRGMQNCINCSNGLPILNGAENDFFSYKLGFEAINLNVKDIVLTHICWIMALAINPKFVRL